MFALIIPIGAVDPGFGGGIPGYGGGYPSHGLPPFPGMPGHDLPHVPGHPGNALPPLPPDMAHPGQPIHLPPAVGTLPIYPITPDNTLPTVPPGVIWPPLPPQVPTGKAVALVAISGVGWRWTVIDTTLTVGYPLPPAPTPK